MNVFSECATILIWPLPIDGHNRTSSGNLQQQPSTNGQVVLRCAVLSCEVLQRTMTGEQTRKNKDDITTNGMSWQKIMVTWHSKEELTESALDLNLQNLGSAVTLSRATCYKTQLQWLYTSISWTICHLSTLIFHNFQLQQFSPAQSFMGKIII